jgi:hypothetical protein
MQLGMKKQEKHTTFCGDYIIKIGYLKDRDGDKRITNQEKGKKKCL